MGIELAIGDAAPNFTLPTNGGGEISLANLKGNMVVLYFYPKDNTPGCTTEAIAFSDLKNQFDSLGVTIIGVSKDSVKKHETFITKQNLKIILGSDPEGIVIEKYGVWVLKKNYGREYMGIERSTYLIDTRGKIAHIWPKVRVKNHAQTVLDVAKASHVD
ncbi:MAG: thioredoxin-dependent thiol peroxidase [Robiginitomaculum sp.]